MYASYASKYGDGNSLSYTEVGVIYPLPGNYQAIHIYGHTKKLRGRDGYWNIYSVLIVES